MQSSVIYTSQGLRSKYQHFPTKQDLGTNANTHIPISPYYKAALQLMATFSSLHTELLHQVSSYLAPFDQVALSTTSKNFHAILKPRIPLDQISQHIYLSLLLTTANPTTSIFLSNHFAEVQTLLENTYHSMFPTPHLNSCGSYIPPPPSPSVQREVLQHYFPDKAFPQCTIAHCYFSTINRFAELVYESAFGNDFGELIGWACVRMNAQKFLQRLENNLAKTEAVKGPALALQ